RGEPMPGVSWDTFERYQQKGLDARRAGQWDSARIYLLEAARAMVELSKDAQGDELREARRATASKLLELSRDCEKAKSENHRRRNRGHLFPSLGRRDALQVGGRGRAERQKALRRRPERKTFGDLHRRDRIAHPRAAG